MWLKIGGLLLVAGLVWGWWRQETTQVSGAPPYEISERPGNEIKDRFAWVANWKRPNGPARIALQAGHYKANEAPEEQKRLRSNTGASGGGKSEWEVNLKIAEIVAKNLENHEVVVEILPTKIPPGYWADVFVAIHADGSLDEKKSGFKGATAWSDLTGKADQLLESVEIEYSEATGMNKDKNVTTNMRGYYAFSWWRYEHAIHPMTTAIILETGFLTSSTDRKLLVDNPEPVAEGISRGIIKYLQQQELI